MQDLFKIVLICLLSESLNSVGGKQYPEVILKEGSKDVFDIIDKNTKDNVGAVAIKNIDGLDNVIYTIFIDKEYREKSYALPTYVELVKKFGYVYSGEFKENGARTSFVSVDAEKVWKRFSEITQLEKVTIQGDKFRYKLTYEALKKSDII